MEISISDFKGINTYDNPFNVTDGNIIHCLNLASNTNGSKIKRPGYSTFLGTTGASQVNSLFSWTKDDGTTLFVYAAAGSVILSSAQGTGAWTPCVNGTISDGAHVTNAKLDNNMVIGDGVGTMRYTTDGTTFVDMGLAPVGGHDPVEYQGRIYAQGTTSYDFYSTTGTASDWASDSSSILIGGSGKLLTQFKAADRIVTCKNSGALHRWDGDSLTDMATRQGPTSPYSIGEIEDFRIYLNRTGIFMTKADNPELISNTIQRQIYNPNVTGISDTIFDTAPGGIDGYNYLLSVDDITDDFTGISIPDAIIVYDYHHNQFSNYRYANLPTTYHQFKNASGKQTFIFGDASGQVYVVDDAYTSDNGQPIEANMVLLLHGNMPHIQKDFGNIEFFTNPGCQAKVQFMIEDVVSLGGRDISGPKVWKDLCSLTDGYVLTRFPPETRGRLLYLRIYESGTTRPWEIFSIHYSFEPVSI